MKITEVKKSIKTAGIAFLLFVLMSFIGAPAFAHCDSYNGPVIKDAVQAIATNNVKLVLKWVSAEQEKEIISLFNKTQALKTGNSDTYKTVEKYFFETLVRLHRETEKAPYTGLKPAGTTKEINLMTDEAIKTGKIEGFIAKLNTHLIQVIREKYLKVSELSKVKDQSTEQGRAFVKAYVDYTHTIEALNDILQHGGGHEGHKE